MKDKLKQTTEVAAAGENFVAFQLSAMSFPAALTRVGSQAIDLLVGDPTGNSAVMVQVKTSDHARRRYKQKLDKNHWEWDVGKKALKLTGDAIFYAFVDLNVKKRKDNEPFRPDVFIVPTGVVAAFLNKKARSRYRFWLYDKDADQYRNKWEFITDRLAMK